MVDYLHRSTRVLKLTSSFGLARAHSHEREQKMVSDIAILLYHPRGGTRGEGPRHAMVGSLPVLDLQARLAIGVLLFRSDHATAQSANVFAAMWSAS